MASLDRRFIRAICFIAFAAVALLAFILTCSPGASADTQADDSVDQQVTITIDTNFPGLLVGYDTNPLAPAPVSFDADMGSVHMIITKWPQPDNPVDTRYRFESWRGGPTTWGWNITVNVSATYFADFGVQFLITTRSNIPGPNLPTASADCSPMPPNQGRVDCWVDEGSSPVLIINSPQVFGGCRYVFIQWGDGNTQLVRVIGPITGPATYLTFWTLECRLTMAMDSSCLGSVVPASGWHTASDNVNIDWIPPTGLPPGERYRFRQWIGTGNGSYSGPVQSVTITINGEITETAFCFHEFLVTVDTDPTLLAYSVDSQNLNGPYVFWAEYMSVHWFNVTQTIQGGPTTRYVFSQWSDGETNPNHPPATIIAPLSLTAFFGTQFKVTLNQIPSSPTGIGDPTCDVADCWYDSGRAATVMVTSPWPSGASWVRYTFLMWSDDASGTATSFTFSVMDAPKIATANWLTQYRMGITSDCGTTSDCGSPVGAGWYDLGDTATISVTTPFTDVSSNIWYFTGWSGDASGSTTPVDVLMDGSKNVTASWSSTVMYSLTVITPHGTAACSPNADCMFPEGSMATVTLSTLEVSGGAGTRFVFDTWMGDATNSSHPLILEMDGPKKVTAVWKTQYLLTVISECGGEDNCGSPTGAGWYDENSSAAISVEMTHTDQSGKVWTFHNWTGATQSDSNSTIVVMNAPQTAIASWTERPPHPTDGVELWVWLLPLILVIIAVILVLILWMAKRKRSKGEEHKG